MKLFIFAQPRTRSTYLQDILCNYYNIENLYEPVVNLNKQFEGKAKFYDSKRSWEMYKDHVSNYFSKPIENTCVKVLSDVLINNNFYYRRNFNKDNILEPNDIINPIDILHLDKYDKVFLLRRKSIVDIIISYHYCYQIGNRYNFKENDNTIEFFNPIGKKLYVSTKKSICTDLLHIITFEYVCEYLKNKNIKCIELYYEDIPNYVNLNFQNATSVYKKQNFDYNTLTNYNDMAKLINECISEIKEKNNFSALLP